MSVIIPMEALLEFAGTLIGTATEVSADATFGINVAHAILAPWQYDVLQQATNEYSSVWKQNHEIMTGAILSLLESVQLLYENWTYLDHTVGPDDFYTAVTAAMLGAKGLGHLRFPDTSDIPGQCKEPTDISDEYFTHRDPPPIEELHEIYGPAYESPRDHTKIPRTEQQLLELWEKDEQKRKEQVLGIEDDRTWGEKTGDFLGDLFSDPVDRFRGNDGPPPRDGFGGSF